MTGPVWRSAAFVLFLLVSVGLGLEAGVRVVIPQALILDPPDLWEPSSEIGWRRRPNSRVWVNTAGREVEICTDARGDRIDCDAREERSCERRILVIGDSFVAALAVPFRETVWSRLERDTGACADVTGVGGYGMSQYVEIARERLRDPTNRYDLVILNFFSGNDFTKDADRIPSYRLVELGKATLGPRPPDDEEQSPLSRLSYRVNRWLGSHSHAYVAALLAVRRLADPSTRLTGLGDALRRSTLRGRLLKETVRGIQLVSDEAERAESALLLVVIPNRTQVMDPRGARIVALFPSFEGDVDMNLVTHRFVPRVEKIRNVEIVDLLPRLREHATEASWTLDRHLSSQGHELWFEALREPVREMLQ